MCPPSTIPSFHPSVHCADLSIYCKSLCNVPPVLHQKFISRCLDLVFDTRQHFARVALHIASRAVSPMMIGLDRFKLVVVAASCCLQLVCLTATRRHKTVVAVHLRKITVAATVISWCTSTVYLHHVAPTRTSTCIHYRFECARLEILTRRRACPASEPVPSNCMPQRKVYVRSSDTSETSDCHVWRTSSHGAVRRQFCMLQ